jgi:synaptobrevin family protein YKT6
VSHVIFFIYNIYLYNRHLENLPFKQAERRMKLTAIAVVKYNGPDTEPYILSFVADLSSFGYFQRSSVKEFLMFVSRTVSRKTAVGQRQTVQQDEYFCHAYNRDGLVGIAFADQEYPVRAGFSVVNKVLDDFEGTHGQGWRGATKDTYTEENPALEASLQRYQVSICLN